ncbi:MAG: DUF559 domain-containing protein [Flavobacteriales bacterium]|jgi:very-short-patch-repair endonuclease|nr:DUF559 domain-containing protein [Flavobacteriales bacterium]
MKGNILPYNPILRKLSKQLRNNPTKMEVRLWTILKNKNTGVTFNRQVPILNYIVDFYSKSVKLVVEVDGKTHDHKVEEDEERQKIIEDFDISFLRFTDDEIQNHLIGVEQKIRDTVFNLQKTKNSI